MRRLNKKGLYGYQITSSDLVAATRGELLNAAKDSVIL